MHKDHDKLPWPAPKGAYDSDGPDQDMEFTFQNHRFRVTNTGSRSSPVAGCAAAPCAHS